MKKRFDRFCLMMIAVVVCAGLVPAALAGAIYSTFGPGDAFDTNDFVHFTAGSPPGAYADEFTIPVSANVSSVSLALEGTGTLPGGGATVTVSIRTNLTGQSGVLSTFTAQAIPDQAGVYTFGATTSIHLNAGTEYWLTAGTGGAAVRWFENDQGIDSNLASRSGGIWTMLGSEPALAFSINVPEPGSFGLCAVAVATGFLWRRRIVPGRK